MATYRHKTVQRYRIVGANDEDFEFKNGVLVIKDEERNERFLEIMSKQPAREQRDIVVINEEAAADLERDLTRGPRVVRGAQGSGEILGGVKGTGVTEEQLKEQERFNAAAAEKERLAREEAAEATRVAAELKAAEAEKERLALIAAADAEAVADAQTQPLAKTAEELVAESQAELGQTTGETGATGATGATGPAKIGLDLSKINKKS